MGLPETPHREALIFGRGSLILHPTCPGQKRVSISIYGSKESPGNVPQPWLPCLSREMQASSPDSQLLRGAGRRVWDPPPGSWTPGPAALRPPGRTCLSRLISCSSSTSRALALNSPRPEALRPLPGRSQSSLYICRCSSSFRKSSMSCV